MLNMDRWVKITAALVGAALLAALGASLSSAALGAPKNLIRNGGFESPLTKSLEFDTVRSGSGIGAWKVASGDVDVISGYWQPAAGRQSLDLNGYGPGSIVQTIRTRPGRLYLLKFALAFDPGASVQRTLVVLWGGRRAWFDIDAAPGSREEMQWQSRQRRFKAAGSSVSITFLSRTPGRAGPALDTISVTEVG